MADDRRLKGWDEAEQDAFRGQLTAYRNLCAFVRNLIAKLPPPGDGHAFALHDEVALRFFRLQQMTEGSIDLSTGEADPLRRGRLLRGIQRMECDGHAEKIRTRFLQNLILD